MAPGFATLSTLVHSTLALEFYDDSGKYEYSILEHVKKYATKKRNQWRAELENADDVPAGAFGSEPAGAAAKPAGAAAGAPAGAVASLCTNCQKSGPVSLCGACFKVRILCGSCILRITLVLTYPARDCQVQYCSVDCQKAHRPKHRDECLAFALKAKK